jgi:hypothetical protein
LKSSFKQKKCRQEVFFVEFAERPTVEEIHWACGSLIGAYVLYVFDRKIACSVVVAVQSLLQLKNSLAQHFAQNTRARVWALTRKMRTDIKNLE